MYTPWRRARLLPLAAVLALAACRTTPPDNENPVLNTGDSNANLEASVSLGSLVNAYALYSNITAESITSNPDNLQGIGIDGSGGSGLITLEPPDTQTPGIYEIGINAENDTDDSKPAAEVNNLFLVNVLPAGQPTNPTIIDFAMNGTTSQTATITLFTRNGITNNSQNLQLVLPNGSSAAGSGVTVNSLTPVASGTDTGAIQANITLDTTKLVTSTAVDSSNNTYTDGILLEFLANPPANGFSPTPYTEMVYIRPQ